MNQSDWLRSSPDPEFLPHSSAALDRKRSDLPPKWHRSSSSVQRDASSSYLRSNRVNMRFSPNPFGGIQDRMCPNKRSQRIRSASVYMPVSPSVLSLESALVFFFSPPLGDTDAFSLPSSHLHRAQISHCRPRRGSALSKYLKSVQPAAQGSPSATPWTLIWPFPQMLRPSEVTWLNFSS